MGLSSGETLLQLLVSTGAGAIYWGVLFPLNPQLFGTVEPLSL